MKTHRLLGGPGCLLAAFLLLALAGCGNGGKATSSNASATAVPDPSAAVVAVINAEVAASNAEDIDAYMACIDPSSPSYSSTRDQMTTTFEKYDFHIEVTDVQVLDLSATVAHVQAVLTTTEISGPSFSDNRLTAVFELHTVNGAWKIYSETASAVENI